MSEHSVMSGAASGTRSRQHPNVWGRFTRAPLQALRTALRLLTSRWQARACTSLGPWFQVHGRMFLSNQGELCIGERVRVRAIPLPVELAALPGGSLKIGDRTFINSGVSICAQTSVEIGADCAIGNHTLIMDTDFHVIGDINRCPAAVPVLIEDEVWLGARVTVLKGVRIGRGAVVAAGAVVTRDVAPYTLVGGVPARPIRTLTPGSNGSAVAPGIAADRSAAGPCPAASESS